MFHVRLITQSYNCNVHMCLMLKIITHDAMIKYKSLLIAVQSSHTDTFTL